MIIVNLLLQLFALGVVTTDGNEFATAFTPDGRTVYWTRSFPADPAKPFVILQSTHSHGWSAPRVASFSGGAFSDGDPAVSPDGKFIAFMSRRPRPGAVEGRKDHDIWIYDVVRKTTRLVEAASSDSMDIAPSVAADGAIYFCSGRSGSMDAYRTRRVNGEYREAERIQRNATNVFAAPDQSYIVFSRSGDLYLAMRQQDGSFGNGQPIAEANSAFDDYAPTVKDGYLYFTSRRPRAGSQVNTYADVYRVKLSVPGR